MEARVALQPSLLATVAALCAARAVAAPDPIAVLNRGIGGQTTREGLARFERDVLAAKPDHLLLYFGMNDSANSGKLVPLEEFRKNLQTMIDRARAGGTERVVLVTLNPVVAEYWALRHPTHPGRDDLDGYQRPYDEAIRAVAKGNGLPLADLRRLVEEHGGATKEADSLICNEANVKVRDGVHLTEEGYRLLAELFEPVLRGKVKPGQTVVCFGDSLMYGSGVAGQGTSGGRTYPAWLWLGLNRMIGATDRTTPLEPLAKAEEGM